jgi:hypothetical protein
MSSFIEKAKQKATSLTQQAKEKFDDIKDNRKADELLDDLGRIVYRQRTERGEAGDDAAIADLVGRLQALEAEGTPVLGTKQERDQQSDLPPPAPMAPPATPT